MFYRLDNKIILRRLHTGFSGLHFSVAGGVYTRNGIGMAELMDHLESEIRRRIHRGDTYEQVSRYLSARNVRRFCSSHGIHYRSRFSDQDVDDIVRRRVSSVGHSYGRRSIHGLLSAEGIHVSQRRLASSLQRSFPFAYAHRRQAVSRSINPVPYRADFFGEKLHLDQNEKLAMYGVTHVVAVDGYSRKIVGFSTMPVKNGITIYNTLFRPLLLSEGMWDQLRADHGTEFVLVATVQQHLASLRSRGERHPVLRTTSRQNHRAERLWVEVNSRVNYPVKRVLVQMEEDEVIDMTDGITKFSVSWVTIRVVASPINQFVRSWNAHRIPGRSGGIPNVLARSTCRTTTLTSAQVPSVTAAVNLHEGSGGRLTRESVYGNDPIAQYPGLCALRERDFNQ